MTKGKVVLVPFPFDDLSDAKLRPAVCLTEPTQQNAHVVLAFITSKIQSNPEVTDVVIEQTHSDFKATGLLVASTIRLHRLMTVTTELLQRELGELSPNLLEEVENKLKRLFDLQT